MRRNLFGGLLAIFLVFALAACGAKSQEDVIKELDKKMEELSSYKAEAKMTLTTGSEPQVYDVEIWYKQPSYYRVNLKNAEKEQNQMILRNDEGVFVLTPALNKSFRFQSDWPKNGSQAYLYESLVKDILNDSNASFKATKNHYVFETKTNYQNSKMLPKQEIILNKKDLSPVSVKVMDTDMKPLLTVEFSKVEFNAEFDKNAFDTEKNMTRAQLDVPTIAQEGNGTLEVMYPLDLPAGVEPVEEKEIATENGKRLIMTFGGEKSFTLIQEKARVLPAMSTPSFIKGEPVDLGFAIGALTDHSLTWSYNGVDFTIASNDLTPEEMMMIARSVQGTAIK
ncbi:LolA family protein [Bacillus alveayuensis]|jgi:outer membrane lipoprotein-sorting protein|uniref:LolA family protein n=1 Tax=Aeribacillus alveayuensis TaxID=279215 RepID=UPI0005D10E4F|nr:outer membrane lipoprotein carrier protein LolA [Bacillus alveayuensis]